LTEEIASRISQVGGTALGDEKARQEAIALHIRNQKESLFLTTLATNIGAAVGLVIAASGAWTAFSQYITVRKRERLDRAGTVLNELWKGISDDSPDVRAGSIAGLQEFLTPDKEEFHPRVIAALSLVGRMENTLVVTRTLRPVIETAMRRCGDVVRQMSWQGLKLHRANFAGMDLSGIDFRDADLEEADFSNATLIGVRFNAARLIGAVFHGANLIGANLEHADLADTDMSHANLRDANLRHVKVLNLNLASTDLTNAAISTHAFDWRLTKNWRSATFDPALRQALIARHGPDVSGPCVLMLLWEFPRVVYGGGWTAAFHVLMRLRREGAHVTLLVPLAPSDVSPYVFGNEIRVEPLGDEDEAKNLADFSAYSSPASNPETGSSVAPATVATTLFDAVAVFRQRALDAIQEHGIQFDIIHAHDWLTFPAAQEMARERNIPWVAHIHSTEVDRQLNTAHHAIVRIERRGCRSARHIVTVSTATQESLTTHYGVEKAKITVVPNCLSEGGVASTDLGSFESKRVVFLGRMTRQKGPDLFARIAVAVSQQMPEVRFFAFGRGEEEAAVRQISTLREIYVPPDRIVPPFDGDDLPEELQHIEIKALEPISYDEQNATILRLGQGTAHEQRLRLIKALIRRGFTATAIRDPSNNYTHRLEVRDTGDGFHRHYLALISGWEFVRTSERQCVETRGGLHWENRTKAFDGASVLLVPSRSEPFGMVVLEGMRHGVPVVFTESAGVGEVVQSGIRIKPEDVDDVAAKVLHLLRDREHWKAVADGQLREIATYADRGFEERLKQVWNVVIEDSKQSRESSTLS
jgi:glycosyltransferase involved in cell wall biosynthesis